MNMLIIHLAAGKERTITTRRTCDEVPCHLSYGEAVVLSGGHGHVWLLEHLLDAVQVRLRVVRVGRDHDALTARHASHAKEVHVAEVLRCHLFISTTTELYHSDVTIYFQDS